MVLYVIDFNLVISCFSEVLFKWIVVGIIEGIVVVGVDVDGVGGIVDGGFVLFLVELEELFFGGVVIVGGWVGGLVVVFIIGFVVGLGEVGFKDMMFIIYVLWLGFDINCWRWVLNFLIIVDVFILNIFWVVVFLIENLVVLFYDELVLIYVKLLIFCLNVLLMMFLKRFFEVNIIIIEKFFLVFRELINVLICVLFVFDVNEYFLLI